MLVSLLIDHLTVIDGNEAGVDLVLIQLSLASLIYVKLVGLMLTSIFQAQFPHENKPHYKEVSSKHVNLSLTFKLKAKVLSLQL